MGLFGKKEKPPPPGRPELDLPKERLLYMFQRLVRNDPDRPCPWCQQSLGPSKDLCNFCGRPVPRPLCLNCGTPLLMGFKFCGRCGKPFDPAEVMRAALKRVPLKR